VQPVVTEYQVVQEKGSEANTVTVTDEINQVNETSKSRQEMEADDSSKAYLNETAELKQDEQERSHQVKRNEKTQMLDKAELHSAFLSLVAQQDANSQAKPSSERSKRAHDTRALSPLHCHQLRRPNAAVLDSSHACSRSAPRTSSRPSRDTHALSPVRPLFWTCNTVVPVYFHVLAEIDSGDSMTMRPHALFKVDP